MGVIRTVLTPFRVAGKVVLGLAAAELAVGGVIGLGYGAVDNLASDQSAVQSAKTMFHGTHDFVADAADGWFKGDTDPSTLKWAKATKWATWPVTATGAGAGAFLGNGTLWLAEKAGGVVGNWVGHSAEKLPDVKSSTAVTVPQVPQNAQMKISYRVDDKKLG